MSTLTKQKLCLIAGSYDLPVMLAKSALKKGDDIVCFAVTEQAYNNLKDIVETYKFSPIEVYQMVDKAKELGITEVTFIGKVPKMSFFKNLHKLDSRLVKTVKEVANLSDDTIHEFLANLAEKEFGITIVEQTKYLKELFPSKQVFSHRQPNLGELREIEYGISTAKEIARLDIGQVVVANNKTIVAIEGIEGTNACIKKAKKLVRPFGLLGILFNIFSLFSKKKENNETMLSRNGNITVCKVSRPNQDPRFDIPTVGLGTLQAAGKNSIVAFEANEVFFVNQREAIEYANKNNICLLAV